MEIKLLWGRRGEDITLIISHKVEDNMKSTFISKLYIVSKLNIKSKKGGDKTITVYHLVKLRYYHPQGKKMQCCANLSSLIARRLVEVEIKS